MRLSVPAREGPNADAMRWQEHMNAMLRLVLEGVRETLTCPYIVIMSIYSNYVLEGVRETLTEPVQRPVDYDTHREIKWVDEVYRVSRHPSDTDLTPI